MALTEYHLLAYLLDPIHCGIKLTNDQLDSTLNYVSPRDNVRNNIFSS